MSDLHSSSHEEDDQPQRAPQFGDDVSGVAAARVAASANPGATASEIDAAASAELADAPPKTTSAGDDEQRAYATQWLAAQSIGALATPPREPLGARLAALLGRRHGALIVVCTALLWAVFTLRPPDQGQAFRRGAIALDNIVAPRAARVLDRRLTDERKRAAAALVPTVYDGTAEAPAQSLAELRRIALARRDTLTRRKVALPAPQNVKSGAAPRVAVSTNAALENRGGDSALSRAASAATSLVTENGDAKTSTSDGKRIVPSRAAASRADAARGGATAFANRATSASAAFPETSMSTAPPVVSRAEIAAFNAGLVRPLSFSLALRVLAMPDNDWNATVQATQAAVRAAYVIGAQAQPIRSDHLNDDLEAARRRMENTARKSIGASFMAAIAKAPQAQLPALEARVDVTTELAFSLARETVRRPNFVFNERKTAEARRDAGERVPAAYSDIQPGTVLVEAGARIDDAAWAQLQDLDLVASRVSPQEAAAHLVLCAIMVAFCALALTRFQPQLLQQPVALWLSAMLPIFFIGVLRLVLRVPQGDELMVPLLATAAMAMTLLFGLRVGLLGAFLISVLGGLMARADSSLLVATMVSSSVGAMAVSQLVSQRHLVRAALFLGLTNAILAVALNTLRGTPQDDVWRLVAWSGGTGAAAVGVAAVLVMLLERPFGVSTHLGLLELAAPGEELMLRLQKEAPGTYTHSLMVSQMSEAAAKAVGADSLLCRVGALYHDIGKLRRPNCFVENQGATNIHEHLTPQMSAVLIISHVQDGLDLGRSHRLPKPVLDIIAQHHGSTLLAFFYHRAHQQEKEGAPPVDGNLFRYAGPKPQSKEAAIVLLADTVEASARALPLKTFEELQEHIRSMASQRLGDGELADCDLTLRDLETIQASFAQVLRGALHKRIEYPKPEEKKEVRPREWPWTSRGEANERRRYEGARDGTISALNAHLKRSGEPVNQHEKRTSPRPISVATDTRERRAENGSVENGHAENGSSNGHASAAANFHDEAEPRRRAG